MNYGIRQVQIQVQECSVCKHYHGQSDDSAEIALFGITRYARCPCCLQIIPKPWSKSYKNRYDKFLGVKYDAHAHIVDGIVVAVNQLWKTKTGNTALTVWQDYTTHFIWYDAVDKEMCVSKVENKLETFIGMVDANAMSAMIESLKS